MKYIAIAAALTACCVAAFVLAQTQPVDKASQVPLPPEKAGGAAAESTATKRTLRIISDFKSPPFSYREGMKRVGFEVDLAEALGKELGAKIERVEMDFNISAYASALDMGKADAAMSSISITNDRKERLAFTRPYYRAGFAIAVKKDVDWVHQWFTSGLKGWKIGVMRGTTGEQWARDNLDGKVETYSSVERLSQALKNSRGALKSGKAGFCVLHDETILKWILSDYSYHYEIVERKIVREYYGIALSKKNTQLLAELNAALGKLRENGTYKNIYQKWYSESQDMPMFNE